MINHSFAVMAYNDSPFLPACLDSIKAQTLNSIIYITTSTPSEYIENISKKYGVDLYITEKGLGIAHDWNFSLHQAKTKYVTLAHQDDLYHREYSTSCIKASEKFKDTLICFTGYNEVVDDTKRTRTLLLTVKKFMLRSSMPIHNHIQSEIRKNLLLFAGCPIAAPSVMYNLENLKGFQFSTEFSINMDWDAWCRMARMEGRFVYVKKELLTHRIHPDSATTAGLKENIRQREDLKIFKRFWPGLLANQLVKLYARSYKSNIHKV
ncbi:MAG: glycosyltransferase [Saprospiraceae bacterium]|uniref:Glycosyltransferase n=1 Tax=Candidatus Opimibacter skivensis TaxID=2982028 RepID=A0A9D7SV09_9BACT|nr:glycosyltransferase [Candidatus Opimibacter skivensis]